MWVVQLFWTVLWRICFTAHKIELIKFQKKEFEMSDHVLWQSNFKKAFCEQKFLPSAIVIDTVAFLR